MAEADMPSTDRADESSIPVRVNVAGRPAPPAADGSSSRAGTVPPMSDVPPTPAPPKRHMVITHDKYVELQTMIVLHLTGHEQSTGKGMDREELVDWYLEQRESEMHDIEELEYEKELIVKLLRRLVKVYLSRDRLILLKQDVLIRKISYLKLGETCRNPYHQWMKKVCLLVR
jgi:DNA replication licensing factor MCM6